MRRPLPAKTRRTLAGGGKVKGTSLAIALLGWLLLSALNLFIIWAMRDRARLIRDNDNERTLNTLFAEMWNFSDLGSAIESNPVLHERIKGAALYRRDLSLIQRWGDAGDVFDEEILEQVPVNRFGRYTIPDKPGHSTIFVIRFERRGMARQQNQPGQPRLQEQPQLQGQPRQQGQPQAERPSSNRQERRQGDARRQEQPRLQEQPQAERPTSNRQERRQGDARTEGEAGSQLYLSLARSRYFYANISHAEYWRTLSLTTALFPLVEIILLFLILCMRFLYLRNVEYREKIESHHNLVVLGTAAGTLAHEIKNPLLSIRLQTGILEKTIGDRGRNEIQIINQEIERLSSLVYRVNDYLREPAGERAPLNISVLTAETAKRICGIDMPPAAPAMIYADEARIRSVLENVLRNAVESGSPVAEISALVETRDNTATVTISDRGTGVDEKNIKLIFDPFFTSKSTGTGIGLAVSKRFTEAAGGSISAENRKGGGLTVTLVFPLYNGGA